MKGIISRHSLVFVQKVFSIYLAQMPITEFYRAPGLIPGWGLSVWS